MGLPSFDFIKQAAEGILNPASKLIDNLHVSDDEKSSKKAELTKIVMDNLSSLTIQQAKVLQTEMSGNWLQRSWRPLLMLSFGVIIVSVYFLMPFVDIFVDNPELTAFYTNFKDEVGFWSLLKIGMGGYIAGRSTEKVAEVVTKNIDMTFLKKKDRKKGIEDDIQ
ncbi:MAG TPA: hypothetical protein DCY51_01725 [Bacteroidetes bacterium]|nr:hypothetical protein [Bacteroidota bacterium]